MGDGLVACRFCASESSAPEVARPAVSKPAERTKSRRVKIFFMDSLRFMARLAVRFRGEAPSPSHIRVPTTSLPRDHSECARPSDPDAIRVEPPRRYWKVAAW